MAWFIVLGEAAAAFLALDILFRNIPVEPDYLGQRLRRFGRIYAGIGLIACSAGVTAQWLSAGYAGLAAAVCDWLPWWLLWRFGLRKQFTYLFKSDGGHPLGSKEPDP